MCYLIHGGKDVIKEGMNKYNTVNAIGIQKRIYPHIGSIESPSFKGIKMIDTNNPIAEMISIDFSKKIINPAKISIKSSLSPFFVLDINKYTIYTNKSQGVSCGSC